MKKFRAFAILTLSICLLFGTSSCAVAYKTNNGKHKGWYKNSNNPHNPHHSKSKKYHGKHHK